MPVLVAGSTPQTHRAGWRASGASGEQRVPFHPLPPSCDHGMHVSPRGQSSIHRPHSTATPPWSNRSPCYGASMRPVEAHYENGLLRPSSPLALRPNERVAVVVMRHPDPRRWDLARLAGHADKDAALAGAGLDAWADALEQEDRG